MRVQPTVVGTDRRAVRAERPSAHGGRALPSREFANDPLDLNAQRRQVTRLFSRHESL
jgi:hypothetical protein